MNGYLSFFSRCISNLSAPKATASLFRPATTLLYNNLSISNSLFRSTITKKDIAFLLRPSTSSVVQIRFFVSSKREEYKAPSHPLLEWSKEEAKQYLLQSNNGMFASIADKLDGINGKALADYTKEDLVVITGSSSLGIALFNDLQPKKEKKPQAPPVDPYVFKWANIRHLEDVPHVLAELPKEVRDARKFTFGGPVDFHKHYALPSFVRDDLSVDRFLNLVKEEKYFALRAPRQSGKTTLCKELCTLIDAMPGYKSLYVNVEGGQTAFNNKFEGIQAVLVSLQKRFKLKYGAEVDLVRFLNSGPDEALMMGLFHLASLFPDDKFVLIIDEIDSLVGDTLLAVLRQLRSEYDDRGPGRYPTSIVLVGVRDVRDYKIYSEVNQKYFVGGSVFNILAGTLLVRQFSREEVSTLYQQCNSVKFSSEAIDEVMNQTSGQPWLVNRIGAWCVQNLARTDVVTAVNADHIQKASQAIILSRETHIESLASLMLEPRVRKVISGLVSSQVLGRDVSDDEKNFLVELGLLNSNFEPANAIYKEVIPRQYSSLPWIETQLKHYLDEHRLQKFIDPDTNKMNVKAALEGFRNFWIQNRNMYPPNTEEMLEAFPEGMFFAFFQYLNNGKGKIDRQYAIGKLKVDIYIERWLKQKDEKQVVVIELKRINRGAERAEEATLKEVVDQVNNYGDHLNTSERYGLIIDLRNKDFSRKMVEVDGVTVFWA